MSLKLQFNPELDYQLEAINAVVDLFKGQRPKESNFTVTPMSAQLRVGETGVGIGNKLDLGEDEIRVNLQDVQVRNGLKQSKSLATKPYLEFEIDMETGERVIIVTGCINALVSRVSETFIKNNSCIA